MSAGRPRRVRAWSESSALVLMGGTGDTEATLSWQVSSVSIPAGGNGKVLSCQSCDVHVEPCASVGNWSSFAVAWSRLRWKRVGSDAMSTAVSADVSVRSALKLTHAAAVQADSVFE
eukprot:CAMPEP_0119531752 /NCGR_PEP_ID=MMETSP1344-20130328/45390_1 /TAXON_ID=236787 /ORGANISM="Florenciella parvula, Strain CCMP2471" /LENGTH=116 /DNA_ID=CAMNT_0007572089 /DNA_START=1658 /DNA_END=2009 /DNA_ORIENTATION=-